MYWTLSVKGSTYEILYWLQNEPDLLHNRKQWLQQNDFSTALWITTLKSYTNQQTTATILISQKLPNVFFFLDTLVCYSVICMLKGGPKGDEVRRG